MGKEIERMGETNSTELEYIHCTPKPLFQLIKSYILETRTKEVPKSVTTETKTNPEDLDQDRKDENDQDHVTEIDHAIETDVTDLALAAVSVVILRQAIHQEEAVIGGM